MSETTTRGKSARLAEYLRDQARYREEKAEEFQDERNFWSARALREAADYVDTLPDSDPRIQAMDRAGYFHDEECSPGEYGTQAVRLWCFHGPSGGPADLVDRMGDNADADHWASLGPEEVKAAEDRVRRMARRQGLALRKARTRDMRNYVWGTYGLVDPYRNAWVYCNTNSGYGMSLPDCEAYLDEQNRVED